jgi:hypothetical protein
MIEKGNRRFELVTEGDTSYYKKFKLDRGLLLQKQFSGKADSEAFILNSMYSVYKIILSHKKKVKEVKIFLMRLLRPKNSLKMIRQLSINLHKLVANKFEFKTQEGTLPSRYSRDFSGPNMLTRLSIRTVKKVRAFVFC